MLLPVFHSTGGFLLLQHAVVCAPQRGLILADGPRYSMLLSVLLSIPSLAAEPNAASCMFLSAQQIPCCWATLQRDITAAHMAVLVLLVHHQAAVGDARPLPEGGFVPVGCCSDDHCLAELANCQDLQAPAGERWAALQGLQLFLQSPPSMATARICRRQYTRQCGL